MRDVPLYENNRNSDIGQLERISTWAEIADLYQKRIGRRVDIPEMIAKVGFDFINDLDEMERLEPKAGLERYIPIFRQILIAMQVVMLDDSKISNENLITRRKIC